MALRSGASLAGKRPWDPDSVAAGAEIAVAVAAAAAVEIVDLAQQESELVHLKATRLGLVCSWAAARFENLVAGMRFIATA